MASLPSAAELALAVPASCSYRPKNQVGGSADSVESPSCEAAAGAQDAAQLRQEEEQLHQAHREEHLEGHRGRLRGAPAEQEQEQALRGDQRAEHESTRQRHGREVRGDAVNPPNRGAEACHRHPEDHRLQQAERRCEQHENATERRQPREHEPMGRDREHAEDPDVPAIGKYAIPDHEPDHANGNHREGDQDQPIGIELGAERHQQLGADVLLGHEDRVGRARRGGEEHPPDDELHLRQTVRHQVAFEQSREERAGEEPRLMHVRLSSPRRCRRRRRRGRWQSRDS